MNNGEAVLYLSSIVLIFVSTILFVIAAIKKITPYRMGQISDHVLITYELVQKQKKFIEHFKNRLFQTSEESSFDLSGKENYDAFVDYLDSLPFYSKRLEELKLSTTDYSDFLKENAKSNIFVVMGLVFSSLSFLLQVISFYCYQM